MQLHHLVIFVFLAAASAGLQDERSQCGKLRLWKPCLDEWREMRDNVKAMQMMRLDPDASKSDRTDQLNKVCQSVSKTAQCHIPYVMQHCDFDQELRMRIYLLSQTSQAIRDSKLRKLAEDHPDCRAAWDTLCRSEDDRDMSLQLRANSQCYQ